MKPLQPWPEQGTISEVTQLAREIEEQVGEDNVIPWLLVHRKLVQAAVRGYRIGLQDAIERAQHSRN
ncbi:MAG: hypothetical protein IH820_13785 [Bacteroidetes bacterium]|nr:hypothetical protein [Bacteroidota bacterium]